MLRHEHPAQFEVGGPKSEALTESQVRTAKERFDKLGANKEFRHIGTRYAKTDTSFAAALYLMAAILAFR